MIDFTNMPIRKKAYNGANGSKISVLYNDELYMLKFPSLARLNDNMSYANGCISEYLGCKIYKSIDIPVQEVILGTYTTKMGKEKIVVACKDFTVNGLCLQDFASLKNQIVDSERKGYGTELDEILETFAQQTAFDEHVLVSRFWDMFIVDALIGNWDRHNGNWGFLYNPLTDAIALAPVYDCGSSLFPQADETIIHNVLTKESELNHRIYNIPLSAITENGKKIKYFDFISSLKSEDCNQALERICHRIDLAQINQIINDIPILSPEQKEFYMVVLKARKERILDYSLNKLKANRNVIEATNEFENNKTGESQEHEDDYPDLD